MSELSFATLITLPVFTKFFEKSFIFFNQKECLTVVGMWKNILPALVPNVSNGNAHI
jgi:hypothetical protein